MSALSRVVGGTREGLSTMVRSRSPHLWFSCPTNSPATSSFSSPLSLFSSAPTLQFSEPHKGLYSPKFRKTLRVSIGPAFYRSNSAKEPGGLHLPCFPGLTRQSLHVWACRISTPFSFRPLARNSVRPPTKRYNPRMPADVIIERRRVLSFVTTNDSHERTFWVVLFCNLVIPHTIFLATGDIV